jgi:hypothetical protein
MIFLLIAAAADGFAALFSAYCLAGYIATRAQIEGAMGGNFSA